MCRILKQCRMLAPLFNPVRFFIVQNHKLTVVEADGNYVEPFVVDDMDIYSGANYSILLTIDQDTPSNTVRWGNVSLSPNLRVGSGETRL